VEITNIAIITAKEKSRLEDIASLALSSFLAIAFTFIFHFHEFMCCQLGINASQF
jgi:hypothetical protein